MHTNIVDKSDFKKLTTGLKRDTQNGYTILVQPHQSINQSTRDYIPQRSLVIWLHL